MRPSDDGAAGTRRLMETDGDGWRRRETEGYEADLGVPDKVSGDAEGSVGGWFREQLEFWVSFRLVISTYNAGFSAHTHTIVQELDLNLLVISAVLG